MNGLLRNSLILKLASFNSTWPRKFSMRKNINKNKAITEYNNKSSTAFKAARI